MQSTSCTCCSGTAPSSDELILQDAVKVMAKSLVRNRHAVTKMYSLKSQLQAVSLRMAVSSVLYKLQASLSTLVFLRVCWFVQQTLKSTQAMADAMRGATKVCCYFSSHALEGKKI